MKFGEGIAGTVAQTGETILRSLLSLLDHVSIHAQLVLSQQGNFIGGRGIHDWQPSWCTARVSDLGLSQSPVTV